MSNIALPVLFFLAAALARAQQPNILLVIADDVGLDPVPNYMPGPVKATMPNLEALMAEGLTFDNVWADPLCSPTRSTIITGRYGYYTGVLNAGTASLLPSTETTLHRYLTDIGSGYASCIIGKWHLGGQPPDPAYPGIMGVPHYAGLLSGAATSYTNWNLTINGTTTPTTEYITTSFTDMAIDWIDQQSTPWFCWLAYTAPHTPLHLPPTNMHSQGALPADQASINADPLPYYLAMLESVDFELGRVLDSLTPEQRANTIVIFIGDNGTDTEVIQLPYTPFHCKGTLYEGGVRVPLVFAGPGISRMSEREPALVNSSDLFATIVELTGNTLPSYFDSRSLVPLLTQPDLAVRECLYAEVLGNGDGHAIRDTRYKLITPNSGTPRFYDLLLDPWEATDLFGGTLTSEQSNALDALIGNCSITTTVSEDDDIDDHCTYDVTSGMITIQLSTAGRYTVLDAAGRMALVGSLGQGQHMLDTAPLPAGMYLFQCGALRMRFVAQ